MKLYMGIEGWTHERSHPSRVRELKQTNQKAYATTYAGSHPSRVRELKPSKGLRSQIVLLSHPSRVRELKPKIEDYAPWVAVGRTPPGCVN